MEIIIIQDHKENRRKCTLTPLEGRPGFTFIRLRRPSRVRQPEDVEVEGGLLLHPDASPLGPADRSLLANGPLVLIDSTWARVPAVLRRLRVRSGAQLDRRSIPQGVATAYPRVSKIHADPPRGLSSIEAVFAATVILGEPRPDLLSDYHWAGEFLERNDHVFEQFR